VGATSLSTVNLGSTTNINTSNVATTSSQTYSGNTVLDATTTLSASNISLSTVDNCSSCSAGLTLSATGTGTAITLNGALGAMYPLASLSITGKVAIDANISTSGSQTYNNNVVDAASAGNLTLSSSASTILFTGTVDGSNNLVINGATGTTLNGVVGGNSTLISLVINGGTGSNTTLNGGAILTTGNQTYNSSVVLGATTTLTTGGNITFANGVSGAGENLNLVGSSGNNRFTLTGNAAVKNIVVTGSAMGNNTLAVQTNDAMQNFTISSANSGTISGLTEETGTFTFNKIQNLSGSSLSNTFIFKNGATVSGGINGGNTTGTNTIDYSAYTTPINVTLNGNSGSTTGNNGVINSFTNINNLIGNGQSMLTLDGAQNTLYITAADKGYVNDPTNFDGFNSFSSATPLAEAGLSIIFDVPATINVGAQEAFINGIELNFNNVNFNNVTITSSEPPTPTVNSTIQGLANSLNSTTQDFSKTLNSSVSNIVTQGNIQAVTSVMISSDDSSLFPDSLAGTASNLPIAYRHHGVCTNSTFSQQASNDIVISSTSSVCP
jgi:hypothetical protein